MVIRPWRVPEYVWAVAGAVALVIFGFLPADSALHAIRRGTDVYLFLVGMMLLAELARAEGLFDLCAMQAVRHARGSGKRLFVLVYLVGTLVTVFLSNDATAVVLTPAVYAAARAANHCPIFSFAHSSPTQRVLCCRSPILPTWSCLATKCRR